MKYGGVPAHRIKIRFSEDVIKELERIKWWDFPEEKLKDFMNSLNDPSAFIKKYDQNDS